MKRLLITENEGITEMSSEFTEQELVVLLYGLAHGSPEFTRIIRATSNMLEMDVAIQLNIEKKKFGC